MTTEIEPYLMPSNKTTEKLRCVIYARTSSDDPDQTGNGFSGSDRPSIEEQINVCKELCQKHGYRLYEKDIYIDMDFSGSMYPEGYAITDNAVATYFRDHIKDEGKRYRPAAARFLDRIGASPVRNGDFLSLSPNKRRIDIIVVRDIFRLCRIPLHAHIGNHFWQIFSALGTQIHSVKDGLIDADKFNDMLITELKQRTQEHSLNQQRESSKRSMDAIKNRGGLRARILCSDFQLPSMPPI